MSNLKTIFLEGGKEYPDVHRDSDIWEAGSLTPLVEQSEYDYAVKELLDRIVELEDTLELTELDVLFQKGLAKKYKAQVDKLEAENDYAADKCLAMEAQVDEMKANTVPKGVVQGLVSTIEDILWDGSADRPMWEFDGDRVYLPMDGEDLYILKHSVVSVSEALLDEGGAG